MDEVLDSIDDRFTKIAKELDEMIEKPPGMEIKPAKLGGPFNQWTTHIADIKYYGTLQVGVTRRNKKLAWTLGLTKKCAKKVYTTKELVKAVKEWVPLQTAKGKVFDNRLDDLKEFEEVISQLNAIKIVPNDLSTLTKSIFGFKVRKNNNFEYYLLAGEEAHQILKKHHDLNEWSIRWRYPDDAEKLTMFWISLDKSRNMVKYSALMPKAQKNSYNKKWIRLIKRQSGWFVPKNSWKFLKKFAAKAPEIGSLLAVPGDV